MALSVAAGRPVECDRMATFADGMAVRVAVPLAVEELVRLGTPFVEVSERAIARAVRSFAAAGIRVEGSAATRLRRFDRLELPDGPVVLVVTGRKTSTTTSTAARSRTRRASGFSGGPGSSTPRCSASGGC